MRRIKIILVVLFLLICKMGKSNTLFRHIGVESGLSQSTVLAILQDRMGFMWIGTKSGLNRYDGSSFKTYYGSLDAHGLGSSYINVLFEDLNGCIWVGTDCGVWIYNPQNDSFTRFNLRSSDGESIANMVNVIKAYQDKIYITANEQGVFCYDIEKKTLSHFALKNYPNVSGMCIDGTGRVWLGFFGGGLYVTNLTFNILKPF